MMCSTSARVNEISTRDIDPRLVLKHAKYGMYIRRRSYELMGLKDRRNVWMYRQHKKGIVIDHITADLE
jgi:hypothetical protein